VAVLRLTVVSNEIEAEVVCGILRENGIGCSYRATDTAAAGKEGVGMGGPTEIVVNEADLEAARKLLPGG